MPGFVYVILNSVLILETENDCISGAVTAFLRMAPKYYILVVHYLDRGTLVCNVHSNFQRVILT